MTNLFPSESLGSGIDAVNPGQVTAGRPAHGFIANSIIGVNTNGIMTSITDLSGISISGLQVGLATFNHVWINNQLHISNGVGLAGSVLTSTQSGLAWSAPGSSSSQALDSLRWDGNLNPLSETGGMLYSTDSSGTIGQISANTSTLTKILTQIGYGSTSSVPVWQSIPILGSFIFYYSKTASDIGSYFVMNTTLPTAGISTFTSLTNNQLLISYATPANTPGNTIIPTGTINAFIHAAQLSGTKTSALYAKFYEYNLGVSTLINTSIVTPLLASNQLVYQLSADVPNPYSFKDTQSRLVTEVYVGTFGGGSAPSIQIFTGGATDSYTAVPQSAQSLSGYIPYTGATQSVFLGINSLTAGGFSGPGTNLTNLNASNLASGTVPTNVVAGSYSGITSVGNLTQLNVIGIVTAPFLVDTYSNQTVSGTKTFDTQTVFATGSTKGIKIGTSTLTEQFLQYKSGGTAYQIARLNSSLHVNNYIYAADMYDETSTTAGFYAGRYAAGGEGGRCGFFNGTASQNWQIDNLNGTFRWYTPGTVQMLLTTAELSVQNHFISNINYEQFVTRSSPGTPGASFGYTWFDSTNKVLVATDENARETRTVQTNAGIANGFVTAILNTGQVLVARPTFANISGLIASTQLSGTYSGITSLGNLTQLNVFGFVGINTASTTGAGPEALVVQMAAGSTSFTAVNIIGNVNNYLQANIINQSTGNNASADLVVSADNSTELTYFVDMGINNSQFNTLNGIGSAGDAYFYATGNDLYIGNATTNKNLLFFAGGGDSKAKTRMTILPTGQVGVGTTSPSTTFHVQGSQRLTGSLFDTGNTAGTTGQMLVSLGTSVTWLTPSSVLNGSFTGITSIGNLSILSVSGVTTSGALNVIGLATAATFVGNGANLTNLNATNLSSGTVASARIAGAYSGITSVGTLTNLNVTGITTLSTTRLIASLYDNTNRNGTQSGLTSNVLMSTGVGVTWAPIKRSLVAPLMTAFNPVQVGIDSAVFIIPQNPIDGTSTMTFNFKRVNVRVETPTATGVTTINIAKSTGGGIFVGTSILSSNISITGSSNYEQFGTTFQTGFTTCSSGDKLAINFVGVSTFHQNMTIELVAIEA